jgi:hypothetical protein
MCRTTATHSPDCGCTGEGNSEQLLMIKGLADQQIVVASLQPAKHSMTAQQCEHKTP